MKVVKLVIQSFCLSCSRLPEDPPSLSNIVNDGKIPACKVCKKDLQTIIRHIPIQKNKRTDQENTLINLPSLKSEFERLLAESKLQDVSEKFVRREVIGASR